MIKSQLEIFLENSLLGQSFLDAILLDLQANYRTASISKKTGGFRDLSIPSKELKWIQNRILNDVFAQYSFPSYVHGGVKGKSSVTNAAAHCASAVIIKFDLWKFFDSISPDLVKNSIHKRFSIDDEFSHFITQATTFNNSLPQGAPTSVFLANLVALELDELIESFCSDNNITYTRYLDDLTFSGSSEIVEHSDQIQNLITSSGFKINESKTRYLRKHRRQRVTGVVVNVFPNVSKKYISNLKRDLFYCEQFGISGHCAHTKQESKERFVQKLVSRIGYVISVNPNMGSKMLERFKKLQDISLSDKYHLESLAKNS